MPVYTYQGKTYTTSETDPQKALARIREVLGEDKRNTENIGFGEMTNRYAQQAIASGPLSESTDAWAAQNAAQNARNLIAEKERFADETQPARMVIRKPMETLQKEAVERQKKADFLTETSNRVRKSIDEDVERGTTGSTAGNFAAGALGMLSGSAITDPTNLIGGAGISKKLGQAFAKGFGINAGVAVPVDLATQGRDVQLGLQKEYSITDTAVNSIIAGVIGGSGASLGTAIKNLKKADGSPVTEDDAKNIVKNAVEESKATGEPVDAIVKRKLEGETKQPPEQGQLFPETEIDTSNVRNPYALSEEARIAAEVEMGGQGNLFGGQLYTPEELAARREAAMLGEGGPSARNRPDNLPEQRADVDPLSQVPMRESPEAGGVPFERTGIPEDPTTSPTYEGALARNAQRPDIPPIIDGIDPSRPALGLGESPVTRNTPEQGVDYTPNELSTTEQGALNLDTPSQPVKAPDYEILPEASRQLGLDFSRDSDIQKLLVRANEAEMKPPFARDAMDKLAIAARDELQSGQNKSASPTVAGDVTLNSGLRKAIDSGSGKKVLSHISNTSTNPFFYTLAKTLMGKGDFDFSIVAMSQGLLRRIADVSAGDGDVGGLWRMGERRARIAVEYMTENVVLHEAIHAKLVRLQRLFESGRLDKGSPEYAAVQKIHSLYDYVKAKGLTPDDHYGLTNAYEFVTEAFTNKRFQRYLSTLVLDEATAKAQGLGKRAVNAMHALVQYARAALGLRDTPQNVDALSAIIHNGATLMDMVNDSPALAKEAYSAKHADMLVFDNPAIIGHSKRAPVEPLTKDEYIAKNPLGASTATLADPIKSKVLYEAYKEQWEKDYGVPKPVVGYDNRPTEEFIKQMLNPEGQQRADDLSGVKGTADFAANKNLIVRRVVDNIQQAENAITNVRDDLLRGDSIESGLGISSLRYAKHVESVDSLEYLRKKMSSQERAALVEIFNNFIHTSPATILDSKFIASQTGRVKEFLQGLKDLKEKSLTMLNEARKNNGLPPIKDRDDWVISFVRPGAYHVYTIGPDGKSSWRAGFDNMADAEAVKNSLQAKGMKDVIVADAATDARRSALPIEAFYAAQRMAEPGSQSAAMRIAIEEATKTLGIKKYALPRDSEAGGMAGDSIITEALGTDKAFDHIYSSIEAYANATANYVGGNQYFTRINETLNHTQLRERYPNAVKHAMDRYNTFRNVDKANATIAAITGLNKALINTFVVMANPVFYVANFAQFVYAPPRAAYANAKVLDGKGSVSYGVVKGLERMLLGFGDPDTVAIVREAVKNGSVEPRYAESLSFLRQEGGLSAAAANLSGQTLAAKSDSFARLMSYFTMYETGKSAGLTNAKAHEFAARESQAAMINYSEWARMQAINDLGPASRLISPLTTFLTHTVFHIADYMKTTAKGNPGPLLMYLSALAAMSGVEGLPGFDEIDSAIALLSDHLVSKGFERVRTPRELMTASGASDYVRYGLPSAATGINMTGTFGLGNLIPDNLTSGDAAKLFNGPAFATEVGRAVLLNAQHYLGSDVPEAERVAALRGILPSMAKEWVSQSFSSDITNMERTVVNAKGDAEYIRSAKENIKSLLSGRMSIEESQQKYANRRYKANEASVKELKTYILDITVDSIARGKPVPDKVVQAVSNYPELKNTLSTESLTKEMERRNIPYRERQLQEVYKATDEAVKARKGKALSEIYEGTYGNK